MEVSVTLWTVQLQSNYSAKFLAKIIGNQKSHIQVIGLMPGLSLIS